MLKKYRILRDGREIDLMHAASSREAVAKYVKQNIPEFESDGWSSRDFLKYSIKVETCPWSYSQIDGEEQAPEQIEVRTEQKNQKDIQFTLRQMFLIMTLSCLVMTLAAQPQWMYYAALGLIILAPMIVSHFIESK